MSYLRQTCYAVYKCNFSEENAVSMSRFVNPHATTSYASNGSVQECMYNPHPPTAAKQVVTQQIAKTTNSSPSRMINGLELASRQTNECGPPSTIRVTVDCKAKDAKALTNEEAKMKFR